MGYHEKKERYASLYSNGLGRIVQVSFRRKRQQGRVEDKLNLPMKAIKHTFVGRIVEVKKESLRLMLNDNNDDTVIVTIGFRSIYDSLYLDHGFKIKASLYYGAHKPKMKVK